MIGQISQFGSNPIKERANPTGPTLANLLFLDKSPLGSVGLALAERGMTSPSEECRSLFLSVFSLQHTGFALSKKKLEVVRCGC